MLLFDLFFFVVLDSLEELLCKMMFNYIGKKHTWNNKIHLNINAFWHWKKSMLWEREIQTLTFLDNRGLSHVPAVESGHADVGHLEFWGSQQGGGANGGVVKEGGAITLSPAFTTVAVDSCLKLPGRAQSPLFTFIRIEVLHIPVDKKRQNVKLVLWYIT